MVEQKMVRVTSNADTRVRGERPAPYRLEERQIRLIID